MDDSLDNLFDLKAEHCLDESIVEASDENGVRVKASLRCRICAATWQATVELEDVEPLGEQDGRPLLGGQFPTNILCPECECQAGEVEGTEGCEEATYA